MGRLNNELTDQWGVRIEECFKYTYTVWYNLILKVMLTSIILTNRGKTGFRLIAITGTLGKISGTTKGVSAFKIEVGCVIGGGCSVSVDVSSPFPESSALLE